MTNEPPPRSIESVAHALGRTPSVAVIRVIEIRFLRGAGVDGDPMRAITALFREDGSPIVEIDPHRDVSA